MRKELAIGGGRKREGKDGKKRGKGKYWFKMCSHRKGWMMRVEKLKRRKREKGREERWMGREVRGLPREGKKGEWNKV